MLFIGCMSFAVFVFVIGHSTLVHFVFEESRGNVVPLAEGIFPWPKRGRTVSIMCFAVSAILVFMSFKAFPQKVAESNWDGASIFALSLGGFPTVWYLTYLLRRVRRCDRPGSGLPFGFDPRPADGLEWKFPVALCAVINVFSFFH
jgi:hypothetical protein